MQTDICLAVLLIMLLSLSTEGMQTLDTGRVLGLTAVTESLPWFDQELNYLSWVGGELDYLPNREPAVTSRGGSRVSHNSFRGPPELPPEYRGSRTTCHENLAARAAAVPRTKTDPGRPVSGACRALARKRPGSGNSGQPRRYPSSHTSGAFQSYVRRISPSLRFCQVAAHASKS